MAGGGFTKLPGGSVVVALSLPRPRGATDGVRVRVLVHAVNRQRALTRLRNLGLRAVYLRGNTHPPTPDEINAVLHHPDGLVWRAAPADELELWHPIATLLRPPAQAAETTPPGAPQHPQHPQHLHAPCPAPALESLRWGSREPCPASALEGLAGLRWGSREPGALPIG